MNDLHKLMDDVTRLTLNIKNNYPDLYSFLNETAIEIPSDKYPHIDTEVMIEYLETLKQLLRHHIESHKMINKHL